jgi:hypothetical protein
MRTDNSSDIINFSTRFPPLHPENLQPEKPSGSLTFAGGGEDLLKAAQESGDSTLTMRGVLPDGMTQPSKSPAYQPPNNPTTSPLNTRRKETSRAANLWMDSELPSNMANLSIETLKPPMAESHLPLEHPTLATFWEQKTATFNKTPSYDPITPSTPPPKEMDPLKTKVNSLFGSDESNAAIFNALWGPYKEIDTSRDTSDLPMNPVTSSTLPPKEMDPDQARLNARPALDESMETLVVKPCIVA